MIYHIGIGNTINHFRTPEPSADDIVLKKKPKARLSDPRYLAKFAGKYQLVDQTVTVSIRFIVDAQSAVTAAEFIQPDGIYEAKRTK
jgi:hypothetical protein